MASTAAEPGRAPDSGAPASVEVDVSNQLDRRVEAAVEVLADEPLEPGWISVEPASFALDVNEGRRFRVQVTPPGEAPAGDHAFTMRVYDVDRPADAFAEGPPITVSLRRETAPGRAGPPRWLLAAVAAAVLLVVAAIVWLLLPRGEVVPDVEGRTVAAAASVLEGAGLKLGRVTGEPSDRERDTIIRHDPRPGDRVDAGTAVDVVVSEGDEDALGPGPTTLRDVPPIPISPPRDGVVTFAPYSQHDMDPDCTVREVSVELVTGTGTVEVVQDAVDTNNLHVAIEYEVDRDFARVEITWVVDHPAGVACTLPAGR